MSRTLAVLPLAATPGSRTRTGRPLVPVSPRQIARLEDELEFTRTRLSAMEERLDAKTAAVEQLESLNERLRSRLDVFQRQNEENCRAAESEIARLSSEIERLEDTVHFQRSELSTKTEALSALSAQLTDAVSVRDNVESQLADRSSDLSLLQSLLAASTSGALLARVKGFARADHLEISSAGFREHWLLSRILRGWHCARQINRGERIFCGKIKRANLANHMRAWKFLFRAIREGSAWGTVKGQTKNVLLGWLQVTKRALQKDHERVLKMSSTRNFKIWRLIVRELRFGGKVGILRNKNIARDLSANWISWKQVISISKVSERMARVFRNWVVKKRKFEMIREAALIRYDLKTCGKRVKCVIREIWGIWLFAFQNKTRQSRELKFHKNQIFLKRASILWCRWSILTKHKIALKKIVENMEKAIFRINRDESKRLIRGLLNVIRDDHSSALSASLSTWRRHMRWIKSQSAISTRADDCEGVIDKKAVLRSFKSFLNESKMLKQKTEIISLKTAKTSKIQIINLWVKAFWRSALKGWNKLNSEFKKSKIDYKELEASIASKSAKISYLESQKNSLESKINDLLDEIDKFRTQISSRDATMTNQSEQIREANHTKELLTKEIDNWRNRLIESEKNRKDLMTQLAKTKDQLAEREASSKEFEDQYLSKIDGLNSEISDKEKIAQLLRVKVASSEERHIREQSDLKNTISDLRSDRNVLEDKLMSLNTKLAASAEEAKRAHDATNRLIDAHNEEISDVNSELGSMIRKASHLQERIQVLERELLEKVDTISALNGELESVYTCRKGNVRPQNDHLYTSRKADSSFLGESFAAEERSPSPHRIDISNPPTARKIDVARKFEELESRLVNQLKRG